jgi:spore germination cell wall hydrolase CwlJ-like protein
MTIITKRAGAIALATMLFAGSFGVAGSGAIAQDQAEQNVSEPVQEENQAPQVRFVAAEVVQALPAAPEATDIAASEAASLQQLVASTDTSGELSRELMCLAQAIYFEARGEPLEGQLAVARVIINRSESDAFPDDYCSVVTQRGQFSFVRGGVIPQPNTGSAAWTRAIAIARIAHRDQWQSPVGDALYFHASHVRPRWAGRLSARATIDNHIFYR